MTAIPLLYSSGPWTYRGRGVREVARCHCGEAAPGPAQPDAIRRPFFALTTSSSAPYPDPHEGGVPLCLAVLTTYQIVSVGP